MISASYSSRSGRLHSLLREQSQPTTFKPWGRLGFVFIMTAFLFSCISGRLAWVMLGAGSSHVKINVSDGPVNRADIVDRHGEILATNLITFSMFADCRKVLDSRDVAQKLVKLFPEFNENELHRKLSSGKSFIWLKRNLTPKQQQEINALGLVGIEFKKDQKRIYPHDRSMAHILGYTNIDNKGLAGLELAYDNTLGKQKEYLQLSLDLRVQHILRDELEAGMKEFNAIKGNGMLMNIHTGEVVAMISLPDFDPHNPNPKQEDIFNANVSGVYEVGSLFKILTFAMALDKKKFTLTEQFDATKPFMIGKHKISDYQGKNRWLSAPEVFIYSSNIGTVKMAQRVGIKGQQEFFENLGFLKPLRTELKEGSVPMVPREWKDITLATVSYGYGLAISPLQLVSGMASMLNGGTLCSPTFLVQKGDVKSGKRIISSATSESIRRLMHLVVKQGSGKLADVPGYLVGGKSGTANKKNPNGKGYIAKGKHRASFVFAFPMTDPQYIGLITLDEPKGNSKTMGFSTGGWTAAPIAKRFIEKAAPLLNVMPLDEAAPHIQMAMYIPNQRSIRATL